MIRKWETVLWALLGGVALGDVGCGSTLYGIPATNVDYNCSCTVPCGEGDRVWENTCNGPEEYPQYVVDEAEQDCRTAAPDYCAEPPVDVCTCTCEEIE